MPILHQARKLSLLVSSIFIFTLSILFIFLFISELVEIPLILFTRNPLSSSNLPYYIGLLQRLGTLLWGGAAAIALFSFWLLRKRVWTLEISKFLLFSGILSSFFLLDEVFLLHAVLIPEVFSIPRLFVFLFYIIITSYFTFRFIRVINKTEYILLFLAFIFFFVSLAIDLSFNNEDSKEVIMLEDGSKLLGIIFWFFYFVRLCTERVRSLFNKPQENQNSHDIYQFLK